MGWIEGAGLLTAVAAAGAAFGAWKTAERSYATAETVARIERDRHYADLTPTFRAVVSASGEVLDLTLIGPPGLDYLDAVRLTIRDATPDYWPSREAAEDPNDGGRHVEGPDVNALRRFHPEQTGSSGNGRHVDVGPMVLGSWHRYGLDGPAVDSDGLQRLMAIQPRVPMRLEITCRDREGRAWTVYPLVDEPDIRAS